ncbi:MAG TPA: CDP-alcohol phosphatidyltransferase family protein, partial [Polyangiaceae bacterium]|nr:CDP-alcohol phosphatidyltransferase family protein [Polyangiaceae bacterium]
METLANLLSSAWDLVAASRLSPSDRIVGAVGPAVALLAYVVLAYLWFVLSGARTRFVDREAEGRKTGLTTAGLRVFFSWAMRPWIRLLLRLDLPPNAITTVSLGISLAAGVALAAGRFSVGGWLFFAAGACDFFDGRIARAKNIASDQGAALDSIVDRYSESAVLVGLAWYYRNTWVLFPALLAITGSLLVPYVRAKAEALHVALQEVGWLQRPERVVLLATTTALAPLLEIFIDPNNPHPLHALTVLGLLILAVGTQITAGQRTHALLELLAPPAPHGPPARSGFRAIGSSAAATAADAALVATLASSASPQFLPLATALGCLLGALVNFTLNRQWAFQATEGSLSTQVRRYALTSVTGAVLNAGGVAVMLLLPAVPGAVAWILVRGTVFGVWTLPL